MPLSACFAAWTRIFANYTNSHELFYIVSKAALALYRFIIHFQNRESQNSHIVVASCIRHLASCILNLPSTAKAVTSTYFPVAFVNESVPNLFFTSSIAL